ncbi:hypothetical protein OF83DRAFT_1115051 [Amylostereum chailletii]|nr:hypothetical protein OF83DRAFT_1115051 [Amylostereum chailletii]
MDLRNHGHRLVDAEANRPWHTSRAGKHNPTYAIDAVGVVAGTAQDVSFLMDFLPAYLFPSGERKVVHWAAAGISMGSHVVWFALRSGASPEAITGYRLLTVYLHGMGVTAFDVPSAADPRLKTGIIILGCPDNFVVLRTHAAMVGLPFAPPQIPATLLTALRKVDPSVAHHRARSGALNPFWGKNILNVCADADASVPSAMYADFWKGLEVGSEGWKETAVVRGGHAYTRTMMRHALMFFWERCLGEESKVRAHL